MATADLSPTDFDLLGLDPDTLRDPYALYALLLEGAPVFQEPTHGVYLISRYDDIMEIKRQARRFSNSQPIGPMGFPPIEQLPPEIQEKLAALNIQSLDQLAPGKNENEVRTLLAADPPEHTRYRGLTGKLLNARTAKAWEPRIRQIAEDLMDEIVDQETVEWVGAFAHPLPLRTVGEILGVPPGDDALLDDLFGGRDVGEAIGNPLIMLRQLLDGTFSRSAQIYQEYFHAAIKELRVKPREGEFLSDLVHIRDEDGRQLNDEEILNIVSHFQAAGHETSTKMMTQAMYQLASSADLYTEISADRALISNLVEESLRYEAPVQGLFQIAREDVEIGQTGIPAGSILMTLYGAANYDTSRFENPTRFNIHRKNVRAHLSFGGGIHACLGKSLARAEGALGFGAFFDRIKRVRLTPHANSMERTSSYILRGIRSLSVDIEPRC